MLIRNTICRSQDWENRNYSRFSLDYIAYSSNNMGKHCVFLINIHRCKCTTLIFVIMWFGLSHWYTIQDNTGWLFLIQSYIFLTVLCEIVHSLLNTGIIVTYFFGGQHRVFVIFIVTCSCAISILRYLQLGVNIISHELFFCLYKYAFHKSTGQFFSYILTPGQQVNVILLILL